MIYSKEGVFDAMRCTLSDKKIASLSTQAQRQEYWDLLLPGFGIRITKTGHKSFFVMYRDGLKQKRLTLGRYPLLTLTDARKRARDHLRLIASGELPPPELKAPILSIEEAFASFLELYAKRKNRDWKKVEMRLRSPFLEIYGKKPLNGLSQEDITFLLDRMIVRDAPIQANRVTSL